MSIDLNSNAMSPARSHSGGGVADTPPLSPAIQRFLTNAPSWVLFLVAGLWTIPTAGFVVSSLRRWPQGQSGWWTDLLNTETWTLDAYRSALSVSVNNSFTESMVNSLVIAILATVVPLLLGGWAAYAIAWMPIRHRTAVFFGLVALIALPIQAALIPLLQTYSGGAHITIPLLNRTMTIFPDLNLGGSLPAVWLTLIGFALPFAIFLLTVAMMRLPRSVIDSARSDGASHAQIFWHIVRPMATPTAAGLAVLLFIWGWNDYLVGLTMIGGGNPESMPATIRLVAYSATVGGSSIAASACLHSAVSVGVFLVFERQLSRALLMSGEN